MRRIYVASIRVDLLPLVIWSRVFDHLLREHNEPHYLSNQKNPSVSSLRGKKGREKGREKSTKEGKATQYPAEIAE